MSKRTEPPCNNLELVCRLVFGVRWHIELAHAMRVTTRTVRRWQEDPSVVDATKLKNAIRDHRSRCSEAITMLRDGLDLTGVPGTTVSATEDVPPVLETAVEPISDMAVSANEDTAPEAIVVDGVPEVTPLAVVEPVVEAPVVESAPVVEAPVVEAPVARSGLGMTHASDGAAFVVGRYRAPQAARPILTRQIATRNDVLADFLTDEETAFAIAELQAVFDERFEQETARAAAAPEPEVVAEPEPVTAIRSSHGSLSALVDAHARSRMSDVEWAEHVADRERKEAIARLGHNDLRAGDRIRVKHGNSTRLAHVVSRDLAGTVTVMEQLVQSGEWQAPRTMRPEDFERVVERDAPEPEVNQNMERLREKARRRILDLLKDDDLLPGDVIRIQAAGNPRLRLNARVTRRDGGKVIIQVESPRGWGKEIRLMPGRLRHVIDRVGLDEMVDSALAAEAA